MEKQIKAKSDEAAPILRRDIPTFHLVLETEEGGERIRVQVQDAPDGQGKSTPQRADSPVDISYQHEEKLGRALYDAIFIGEIRERFETCRKALVPKVATGPVRLRLLLEIEVSPARSDPLFNVPWELLCDDQGFLSLDHRISIARRPVKVRRNDETIQPPLHVLLTYAEPHAKGLPTFNGEPYLREIEQALKSIELLDLVLLPHATRKKLQQAVVGGVHIFHFMGHGDVETTEHAVMGQLYLENPDRLDLADIVTSKNLQEWMGQARIQPILAVLMACRSANTAYAPDFGVAQALLDAGVSAVAGMQADLYVQEAQEFAVAFYKSLAEWATVDDAMQAGREALNRLRSPLLLRHGAETVVQRMLDLLSPEIPRIRYLPLPSGLSTQQEYLKRAVPFPAWAVPVLFLQGDGWLGREPPKPAILWKVVRRETVYEEKVMVYVEDGRFYVDKYPVTGAEYRRFVEDTGRLWHNPWEYLKDEIENWEKLPATNVTLEDALAYAKWAGKHLPTPEEWQQAALSGCRNKRQEYPWGDEFLGGRCNSRESWLGRPWPVIESEARCGANPAGVCDIVGNVAEWAAVMEQGEVRQRFLCGGSYRSPKEDCTVQSRIIVDDPQYANAAVGFRCGASWAEVISIERALFR